MNEYNGNILYGKKWAVCGDSFSNGDFNHCLTDDNIIEEGRYKGEKKCYGFLIGNRNNMTIQHLAKGGMTIATPKEDDFTNCFTCGIYKEIDEDADYITLYFGINDSHHRPHSKDDDGEDRAGIIPLGTIDDTDISSFFGAWNVVLEYLIEHHPFAHIGIIISNGCETPDYRNGEIALARKWGVPYLDLNGDDRTPAMLRSQNPDICARAKELRMKAQSVNFGINHHPNAKAHEFESVLIENWLRSI